MSDCKDCGFYDEPIYRIIPYDELTFWQKLRTVWSLKHNPGTYFRDQFGDVYYDPDIHHSYD